MKKSFITLGPRALFAQEENLYDLKSPSDAFNT